eukprot:6627037-Pyramimonas_sp.AAC.1
MTSLSLLTPPAVKPQRRERSFRDVLLTGTHGIGRCPRAPAEAMAAGRDDGDCDPAIHYPKYTSTGLQGYWVHREMIYWKHPRENQSRAWHF